MNTYDADARRLNVGTYWGNLRAVLRRWLDRERELVSLRNAVGMMSEARRADAAEWHDMRDLNRELRADALRLRWLAEWIAEQCAEGPPYKTATQLIEAAMVKAYKLRPPKE